MLCSVGIKSFMLLISVFCCFTAAEVQLWEEIQWTGKEIFNLCQSLSEDWWEWEEWKEEDEGIAGMGFRQKSSSGVTDMQSVTLWTAGTVSLLKYFITGPRSVEPSPHISGTARELEESWCIGEKDRREWKWEWREWDSEEWERKNVLILIQTIKR